ADDNASGVSGVLLLAEELQQALEGRTQPRRTILFLTFSGEESGRFGSLHYLEHPLFPMAQHRLMINLDMIGRLKSGKVSVYGAREHAWLMEMMTRHAEASPLDVRLVRTPIAGSDHVGFENAGVPVLFAIIAALHDDYHTVKDQSWKICHVNAAALIDMFRAVVLEAATASRLTDP
ncbi:MAG: M28 family peptidase, partial [Phycisphaerales bacterium]|nr:M28 family peptidase [Phycisphaerales bacterium]